MKKVWIVLGVVALCGILVVGSLAGMYNRFVSLNEPTRLGVDDQ
jgi:hypothetical protein